MGSSARGRPAAIVVVAYPFQGLFYIGDKFPMKWDEELLGALAPHCKLYAGPGAGYDKVDVDWITRT